MKEEGRDIVRISHAMIPTTSTKPSTDTNPADTGRMRLHTWMPDTDTENMAGVTPEYAGFLRSIYLRPALTIALVVVMLSHKAHTENIGTGRLVPSSFATMTFTKIDRVEDATDTDGDPQVQLFRRRIIDARLLQVLYTTMPTAMNRLASMVGDPLPLRR